MSATECAASDIIAADPVTTPATAFMTAIARFTARASSTVTVLSPPPLTSAMGRPYAFRNVIALRCNLGNVYASSCFG
ncbi:hypothetical protein GCM10022243_26400 [Saccharothrix violaceirubra]